MNPSFHNADAFNGNNSIQQSFIDTSSPNVIPSFPMDMIDTPTSIMANGAMAWPSLDNTNELLFMSSSIQPPATSIPVTTTYFPQPMLNNDHNSPVVNSQQQAHIMMLMMQQQDQEQQQQQLLLLQQQQQQEQQQQEQQQQQLLMQQQQQQLVLQQRQAKHRAIPNQRQYSSNTNGQPSHWFMKQQQAKMMQEKLKASSSPSSQASSSLSMHNSPALSPSNIVPNHNIQETEMLLTKRVEAILSINQEIIRLCLEHRNEPDLLTYQSRLQSNLTYLATMADISAAKPEDHLRIPIPPDLSPLPPAYTETANRIHALLNSAQQLFIAGEPNMSPYPQSQQPMMFMRSHPQQQHKAHALPQDFNELTQPRGNNNTVSNMNNGYYYNPQQPMMIMDDNIAAMMYSNNISQ